ncbi:MAG: hypothetical protein K2X25_08330 [Caulobacteraceae bacterium]|nr:hypothetical protein [Caulobacteraceae bacterium]
MSQVGTKAKPVPKKGGPRARGGVFGPKFGSKSPRLSAPLKSYVVRTDTDEQFIQVRDWLAGLSGVRIKSELPTRRALAIEAKPSRKLPTQLRELGGTIRDEARYTPE